MPLEFPTIQEALDFYPVTPGLPPNDYTVLVSDGQYPPFTVDLFNFLSGGSTLNLTIISENGPESTIIQSDGTEPAITVIRTPLATAVDTVVRIGWTELSIPFAPWFCPPEDFQPDRQGWRGFTITGGEATSPPGTILDLGAGIQLLDVFGSIEIRGNIIDDNGDQGTFQGGAIAAMNCRDVLIALNEISNNNAVELGAGIFLTDSRAIVAENFIHHNSIIDNPVVITGFGGGLCSERSDVEVCGNMIFANTAGNAGGGVWLGTFFNGQPLFGEVWLMHNTITSNVLTEGQDGTGILIPFDSDLGYALVFGDGNIVYHNTAELSPFGSEWFAQCGPSGSVPPPGNQFWSFSQMQNLFPGFTCLTGDTNYDLFDGTVPDDTAPPLIVNTKDPHLGDSTSPCVDRGNPGFQASTFPVNVDIDGDDRFIFTSLGSPADPIIDRGADEFREADFKRGDANSDDIVNIADTIKILDILFNAALPENCQDAVDVNDDGIMNIADAIYLQTYLFSGGAPPPAPGPDICGRDPTSGDLLELCVPGHNQCP